MLIYDIITKKKRGEELTNEEIRFFTEKYVKGEIEDYQASALLMAICINGMTDRETAELTASIAESGDMVDLSELGEGTVDKHSTGGVGDKTTLIVAPIVAAAGGIVAKMTGRGLGHTGGTADKLESFPGYSISLPSDKFLNQVKKLGIAVTGQSGDLAPADKKLYALRDVTATVDSIPLITSSIMGKKLASGSRSIVLDVKCGSGSFMKTPEDATVLAEKMVEIGSMRGRNMSAIITNMDRPLGRAVGNILEVKEALEFLSGKRENDLYEVCMALATEMVYLSLNVSKDEARKKCTEVLESGKALAKFREWINAQGGDASFVDDPSKFPTCAFSRDILAAESGYISAMDAELIGMSAVALGAGRAKKEDSIDYAAGIILKKKTADRVEKGEVIATVYSSDENRINQGEKMYLEAVTISDNKPAELPNIFKTVSKRKI